MPIKQIKNLEKYKRIFICAGDGTINSLIETLTSKKLNNRISIATIPGGLGNAVAGMLGINNLKDGLGLLSPGTPTTSADIIKTNLKERPYILFGAALLSPYGIKGAMVHIPFHGFMKITLFLCAGAVMVMTGKKNISQMAGVGRQMPLTMTAFTIGAIGMCGAPPVAGFISKWFLCLGTIQAGSLIMLSVILISSLLDVVYFFPVVKTAFFDRPAGSAVGADARIVNVEKEQPLFLFMIVPLAITALFSIIFCFFPQTFYILNLAEAAVEMVMN